MTIESTATITRTISDGIAVDFPFDFRVNTEDDIQIYFNSINVTLTSIWSINPIYLNNDLGGFVTFNTSPFPGTEVAISRELPLIQTYSWPPVGPFPSDSHETAVDRLTMMIQQLNTELAGSGIVQKGVWVPTVEGSLVAGTGWGYSSPTEGSYSISGNLLFLQFRVGINVVGAGAAGFLHIKGFPAPGINLNEHVGGSIRTFSGMISTYPANTVAALAMRYEDPVDAITFSEIPNSYETAQPVTVAQLNTPTVLEGSIILEIN